MTGIVVVDHLRDWPLEIAGVRVVTNWEYLTDDSFMRQRRLRVYNLCRSFAYQSSGYYVSLLASARDHRPLPDIATIQDLKLAESPRVVNESLDALAQQCLSGTDSDVCELQIYFGSSVAAQHQRLARELFNLFPAPLLKARFTRRNKAWRMAAIGPIALGDVVDEHREDLFEAARRHFASRRTATRRKSTPRFDLAILRDTGEAEPPSNAAALKQFAAAGEALGLEVQFIDRSDYGRIAEYDALFIRETTSVNHHTYRFARRAAREGLVVVDDPSSILRCGNKVFLAQLMTRHGIPTPKTLLIHKANMDQVAIRLGFPCVLKEPDSAFSRGVSRVENEEEFREQTRKLLNHSDLVIAQAFEPTDYDWRIGVLGGVPLYACRYFMAPRHWQIVKRLADGRKSEGQHETLDLDAVPGLVLDVAVRAATAIGDGLYGVDLKQFGNECKLIEVNDNPNIDRHVEDQILGDSLYRRVMEYFMTRLEARGRR